MLASVASCTLTISLIAESHLPKGDLLQSKTLKVVGSFRGFDPTPHLASDTCVLSLVALLVDEKNVHDFALLLLIADVVLPSVARDSCPQPVQKSSAVDTQQGP